MEFTSENIRGLFGPEAAEDESIERLREYYFKGSVYEKIHNDLPIRILVGHKGIGKSASFKMSYAENNSARHVAIWIRPDDIMEICNEEQPLLQRIRDWKSGLSRIIFNKVLESVGIESNETLNKTVNIATRLISKVSEIFKEKIDEHIDSSIINNEVIAAYLKSKKIYVYIDDLDRGWDGADSGIKRISALLNAARDLTNDNPGLCIRISLRSDVYFLVRTSDESTDKIESSVVWYSWTQHQILVLLAKRIQSFFGNPLDEHDLLHTPQREIARYYDDIFDYNFQGRGKWSNVPTFRVLASMIRRRPRDLVKICTLSAETAYENKHDIIKTDDMLDNFDYYSQERLQDTVNEYKSELPTIQRLLMGMKPSNRERHTSEEFIYSTGNLLKKIEIVQGQTPFVFSNEEHATLEQLAGFLYKINFLVARKRIDGTNKIDRRYFEDQKYLSNAFIDFGYKWEVHPAFRWALYPDAGYEIYNSLSIDDEN